MHSVRRSPEPAFLADVRRTYARWQDVDSPTRVQVRDALARDFGRICAYCEQPCQWPTRTGSLRNEETIDHFRPRSRFPNLQFDWLNLLYACKRCNRSQGTGAGPATTMPNTMSVSCWRPYTLLPATPPVVGVRGPKRSRRPAPEQVNSSTLTSKPARSCPADQLGQVEWSMAQRSILGHRPQRWQAGRKRPPSPHAPASTAGGTC